MRQRGRKSVSALAVVSYVKDHRPEPLEGLTEEQAAEWRAVVGRLPAAAFPRECHQLLAGFCRHTTEYRRLSKLLDVFQLEWLAEPDGLPRYMKLLGLRDREGRAMTALATALRISPQSRVYARTAGTKAASSGSGPKPWEPSFKDAG